MADQRRRYAKTPVEPGERRLKYMLFDLVSYIFYLPLLFTGPLMTFDEFYKQVIHVVTVYFSRAYVCWSGRCMLL